MLCYRGGVHPEVTRRELLAGAVAAFHPPSLAAPQAKVQPKTFLRSVRVQTATDLGRMEDFYRKNLGFATESRSSTELCLIAGESRLRFVHVEAEGDGPLTHFAFNIPQNMIRSALDYAQDRFEVNVPSPSECPDSYPKEIYHFHHWNAHSVFFWDPGYNLVEFIARHDLDNSEPGKFGPRHIRCLSEIAFGVKDNEPSLHVQKRLGLPSYPNRTASGGVLGDPNGLLLFFAVGRTWGGTSGPRKTLQTHKTEVEIAGPTRKTVDVPGYPFRISVVP